MSSSKINEAVKEAVIAEVKKLTGFTPAFPNMLHQHLDGNFSVKYVPDIFLRIGEGDLVIFFSPRVSPSDLIWQKAAEMLKICWEVGKAEDTYPETIFPDKSVGYYFNQLKEPLRTKALSQAKNLSEPAEGLAWALDLERILPWNITLEGFDFWQHIYDYLNAATLYPNSEGSKLAQQCAPDNYVFPNPPKKEVPEYIPPTPPVNPIEVALAEIDKLKIRVAELESVKDVEIEALRKHHAETELDAKTLANLAYNRVSAFIGQGITPSQQDFEHWWAEFRKENGYATDQPTKSECTPTPDQIYTLWLLVKEGDKSFPDALPYKIAPHKFQPNVLHVEVPDNFEFTISPNKFYPLANSKGKRPTFDQCRQAIAGTLAVTLETLFNDEVK